METNKFEKPWLLPTLPVNLDDLTQVDLNAKYATPSDNKKIPKNLFINFREVPPQDVLFGGKYYKNLKIILENYVSKDWKIHLFGESERNQFMNYYFQNTSILWIYNQINPLRQVAASDIWRYCALYIWGGAYFDDDIGFHTSLNQIIELNDSTIVSLEKNPYYDCYNHDYHLSEINSSHSYNKTIQEIRNSQ